MTIEVIDSPVGSAAALAPSDMIWVEGGVFRKGSGRHHPEERPSNPKAIGRRPAARHAQPVDTSTSHVGFRCIVRERTNA